MRYIDDKYIFGARLQELRKFRNLTQNDMAGLLNITTRSYQRYEHNIHKPNLIVLYYIANHFNISADWLLGLSNDINKDMRPKLTYDGLSSSSGTHTIRVYLQDKKFKGYFEFNIDGNCKGTTVLNIDFECFDQEFLSKVKVHGMKISCVEDLLNAQEYYYKLTLENNNGDTCDYDLNAHELNDMVVGLEIIDFKLEGAAENEA